jgi:hypothetical protein
VSADDVFELALSTREALQDVQETSEHGDAVNAINAVSPAPTEAQQVEPDAVNAINAVSAPEPLEPRGERQASVPTSMPEPGAKCGVHRRFLTFAEQLHGRCSWCEWQERQDSAR